MAALLIEQAKSWGIRSRYSHSEGCWCHHLTKGASRDYKGVVDYLLTPDEQFVKSDGSRDDLAAHSFLDSTPRIGESCLRLHHDPEPG